MKRKEVEDIMGGKDAWANVDKTDGEFGLGFDVSWWIMGREVLDVKRGICMGCYSIGMRGDV